MCSFSGWAHDRVIGICMIGNRRKRVWEGHPLAWFFLRCSVFNFHHWLHDVLQTPLNWLRFFSLRLLYRANRKKK